MFNIHNNFYNTYDIYVLSAAARYDVNVDAMVIQPCGGPWLSAEVPDVDLDIRPEGIPQFRNYIRHYEAWY
jgi:hypothetical protein